jgi:hypothetical protein
MELLRNAGVDLADTDDFPELDAHAVANAPALGLSECERRSVEELVSGRPGATARFVSERAAALAVDTAGDVRRRSLARAIAVQEAVLSQLNLLLVSSVARKDADATKLLDRALNGATSRFALLVAELRADHSSGKRTLVQVGVANNVTVSGGG